MLSGVWAFIIGVGLLIVLASVLACVIRERDDAVKANKWLHEDNAELRRYLDKRNHQVGNLVVENYEMHLLIRQAREQGFVPRKVKEGREN